MILDSTSSQSTNLSIPPSFPESKEEKSRADLSTAQVFAKIRPLICSINSTIGEASGFFINHEGTILTAAHNIPQEKVNEAFRFTTDYVQINYAHQERAYFPCSTPDIIQQHAEALDLYSIRLDDHRIKQEDIIPFLPKEISLTEGMKVYFAGFPLGQDKVTFHKGIISSITENQGITRFTIDGTVVPGNSGGPVVIQHQGRVYLIGVITSEVADLSHEDREIISTMQFMAEAPIDAMVYSLPYVTPEGKQETKKVEQIRTLHLALDLIQRNLSTGIGKAIDIRHYENLFLEQAQLAEDEDSFSVARGKKLIKGKVWGKQQGQKLDLADYVEVRYGKNGAGNRGISIILCPALGTGTYQYKISPNPHTASGNYNKNQKELYSKAAEEIIRKFIEHNKKFLPIVSFNACKSDYSAELEEC
jgi:V8-like Glu-specific endopeptidase